MMPRIRGSGKRSIPEAEVKTLLYAEVHAQIFTNASLQNLCAVIHGPSLTPCVVRLHGLCSFGHNALYGRGPDAPTPRSFQQI
jgi:hypothetical protein